MSTLRLSIVATAILGATACTTARIDGRPSAGAPDAPECAGHPAGDGLAGAQQQSRATVAATTDFSVEGMFVDCCSCPPPCPCEVTEVAMGCMGVGAHQISRGNYAGEDLAGVQIAHAKVVGKWVNLYIDAKDEEQQAAAEKFGRAAFAAFGPIQEVKAGKIEVSGADGKYTVTVDGGTIMRFETEPVLGGDGKNPIGYTNIKNAVNPTVYQGRCVSATYRDGNKKVTVENGRNSHFNPKLKSRGKI
jgi:hypothetical protein